MKALNRGHGRRFSQSRLAAWRGNFRPDDIERKVTSGRQALRGLFGGLAKHGRARGNNPFRKDLRVIGTCHARIEVDFPIAGEHTLAG
jgi:hypothetical protein